MSRAAFNAHWHKWSTGQGHEKVNFGGQEVNVQGRIVWHGIIWFNVPLDTTPRFISPKGRKTRRAKAHLSWQPH